MRDAKIHIPGPLVGRVQKCIRCHVRLDSNDRWPNTETTGWKPFDPVRSDRHGMSSVAVAESDGLRPCGRAVTQMRKRIAAAHTEAEA